MRIEEMDKETAIKLNVLEEWKKARRKPRQGRFSKEQVRSNAMRVLNVVANLKQSERKRVLTFALQLNEL